MRCFVPPAEPSQGYQICTSELQLIKASCSPPPRSHRTTRREKDVEMPEQTPPPSLSFSLLSHPPPLFPPEPADRLDVLPARRPHRLLGRLSEESQGARGTRKGAVGHLRGPGEEVPAPSQRRPITQVPLQKRWAADADCTVKDLSVNR